MMTALPLALEAGAFAALVLAAALFILAISGHFPAEYRHPALQGAGGTAILTGSSIVTIAAVVLGILVLPKLPWFVAVIAGGGAVLVAPLVLALFSDAFVNGRTALMTFSAVALLASLLAMWL